MSGQGDNRGRRRDGDPAIPTTQKVASRRRPAPGELYVAQTDDLGAAAAIVAGAGEVGFAIADQRDAPGVCWLAAWLDGQMVGVVAVETMVDAAAMHSLAVVAPMRRRGIGAALVRAARKAAHTRGARRLYALGGERADYLARFGFERISPGVMIDDLAGTYVAGYLDSHHDELARTVTMRLDISRDGVIER